MGAVGQVEEAWYDAAPPAGSREITRTVSSPAIVPSTSPSSALSSAEARKLPAPGGVRSTHRLALASAETSSSSHSRASRASLAADSRGDDRGAVAALAGHGVHQRAARRTDLDGVELDQVAATASPA